MRFALLVALTGCASAAGGLDEPEKGPTRVADGGRADTFVPASEDDTRPPSEAGVEDTATSPKDATSIFEAEPACDPGLSPCSGSCVDLTRDDGNCGACATKCAASEKCTAGKCELVRAAPTTKCGATCVNTNSSEAHCGACGNACAAGETCTAGKCIPPIVKTEVTFPSTTSTTFRSYDGMTGALGAGGGRAFYMTNDSVQQTFARSAPATKLTVNFRMSDGTSNYCFVGNLTWNVLVNGTIVGSYSWLGGTTSWTSGAMGPDKTIAQTYSFPAIAPAGGNVTIKLQSTRTVCPGAGSWNWYAGGSAILE